MSTKSVAVIACLCVLWGAKSNQRVLAEDEKVDPLDAKVVATITASAEDFELVALSPDGKTLATVSGLSSKSLELWDAITGKSQGALADLEASVTTVAFTPDGKTVVTADGRGWVGVWDVAARKLRKKFKATLDIVKDLGTPIHAVAVSPDSKFVYVAEVSHAPGIWDVAKGKRVVKDREADGSPSALELAPKAQLLISAANEIRLWDAKTGKERKTIPFDSGTTLTFRFSPDEKSVAGGCDGGLYLIDVGKGKLKTLAELKRFPAVAFSADGASLVAIEDREIGAWDAATGKKRAAFEIQLDSIKAALSADGSIAAVPVSKTKLNVYAIPSMKAKK